MKLNDNKKIKQLLDKLGQIDSTFKEDVLKEQDKVLSFIRIDNILYQNQTHEKGVKLYPWETVLKANNTSNFYFQYDNYKCYIYIWINQDKKIEEIEFSYLGNYLEDIDFLYISLNSELLIENYDVIEA